MIISRTPFRISFGGGGTDLPDFYQQQEGSVVSMAINKYLYITINKRFDDTLRISYSQTEIVQRIDDIRHDLVRETLRHLGLTGGLEITSIADVPAQSGLGSSSSFTVGLLNALYAYRGQHVSAAQLAKEACTIEIERCREPIGKQDQFIAAYGGFQHIRFQKDGEVFVDPVVCPPELKKDLVRHAMIFFTHKTRKASSVLTEQKRETPAKMDILIQMRDLSFDMKKVLTENEGLPRFGELLHRSWELKKRLANGITDPEIDSYYARAREAGALGGKVLGAGGGGFLLLFVQPAQQAAVREALPDLKEVPVQMEPQGSKIIYVGD